MSAGRRARAQIGAEVAKARNSFALGSRRKCFLESSVTSPYLATLSWVPPLMQFPVRDCEEDMPHFWQTKPSPAMARQTVTVIVARRRNMVLIDSHNQALSFQGNTKTLQKPQWACPSGQVYTNPQSTARLPAGGPCRRVGPQGLL